MVGINLTGITDNSKSMDGSVTPLKILSGPESCKV